MLSNWSIPRKTAHCTLQYDLNMHVLVLLNETSLLVMHVFHVLNHYPQLMGEDLNTVQTTHAKLFQWNIRIYEDPVNISSAFSHDQHFSRDKKAI